MATYTSTEEKQKLDLADSSKPARAMPQQRQGLDTIFFFSIVGLSQAVGLLCVVLVIYWSHLYGGFAWTSNPNQQFYYHPTLMIIGLVFCYGDAIIIFRVLSFLPKTILKVIHAAIHIIAVVLSTVALVAVLQYHELTLKPDFYSLHSWIGIATFGLFCFQYLAGFVTFLYPGFPPVIRGKILKYHTFFGLALFIGAVITSATGLTEKLIWTEDYTKALFNEKAVVGNILGLALIVFAGLIVFITTHAPYKRRPLPNELLSPRPTN